MQRKWPFFIKYIEVILIIILFVKIGGYFSIVEERSVNQVFKTISRIGMTMAISFIHLKLTRFGCLSYFSHKNVLAPILYVAYLLLGFLSFSWSTNWQYSSLQWLMTFESFVFVYIFYRVISMINEFLPERRVNLTKLFTWALFPIMIIFIIGSFVEPSTFYRGMRGGEEMRLGGWIMNPNELGMLAGIGGAMSYLYIQGSKKKIWGLLMIVAAIYILLMTSSRSSAIGFVMIMGILILRSENKRLKGAMIVVGIIVIPVMINLVVFKADGGVEEVMSMTGRLPFWKALLNEGIVREPFFGYGFMRINYTEYFQGLNTYPAKMTHNTFMQVLMNLGFVGFFIAFWQLIATVKNYRRNKKSDYSSFFIAVFIPVLINSFTEFGIFGEANYGILFYQFLILLFVVEIRQNRTKREGLKAARFQGRLKRFGT